MTGRILMIGCGNMGGAMLARWLADGLSPDSVTVVSPSMRVMPPGVRVVAALPDPDDFSAETVMLALKPQQLGALKTPVFARYAPKLLISILAGVEIAALDRLSQAQAVVRAMPNLPVAIGRGVVDTRKDRQQQFRCALHRRQQRLCRIDLLRLERQHQRCRSLLVGQHGQRADALRRPVPTARNHRHGRRIESRGDPPPQHRAAHVTAADKPQRTHRKAHASPCVSISAAAIASLGLFPPHSTNWNTG